jgi:hypothetical protein
MYKGSEKFGRSINRYFVGKEEVTFPTTWYRIAVCKKINLCSRLSGESKSGIKFIRPKLYRSLRSYGMWATVIER